eukprot:2854444-Karenia_brevis.AAC.1
MTYPEHFEIIHAIRIGSQSLACVLTDLRGVFACLGLFDMRTGALQHVHQMVHHPVVGRIVHVPREGLIVADRTSDLGFFGDASLGFSG